MGSIFSQIYYGLSPSSFHYINDKSIKVYAQYINNMNKSDSPSVIAFIYIFFGHLLTKKRGSDMLKIEFLRIN